VLVNRLGMLLADQGDLEGAEALLREALKGCRHSSRVPRLHPRRRLTPSAALRRSLRHCLAPAAAAQARRWLW